MLNFVTAALAALWTGAKTFAASSAGKALGTAALNIGANVAGAKIKEEMGMGQPNQIGTGTGAGVQAGAEMEYSPVGVEEGEGGTPSGITDFQYQNPNDQSSSMNQEQLMALLDQAGYQNKEGIVGAAIGGYLKRDSGGAIAPTITAPTIQAPQMPEMDTLGKMMTSIENMPAQMAKWYEGLDPQTKQTLNKTLVDIGTSAAEKAVGLGPKSKTVSPKAGVPVTRRQMKINPIQGSQYADGGALNRSMFAPMFHGGELDGPGGPKDDLIPVMASDGEFMLSKAAVDQAGGGNHRKGIARLTAFNNIGNKRYG